MSETTIRVERRPGFTVLQNDMLRDPRLSLKTKGLLAVVLGLPEDWNYSISGLAKICGTGKETIRSALKEMEGAGYLDREQTHAQGGKFGGNAYVVHEVSRIPLSENPTTVEGCGQPLSGFPSSGGPSTENQTQLNKQESNKDLINTPLPSKGEQPARKRRQSNGPKKAPDWKPERFEGFWRSYPCGKSKQAAIKAWDKLRPDDGLLVAMAKGLQRALASEDWQRGIGIPYASTWINDRRWEDEDKPLPAGVAGAVPSAPPLTPERFGWD